MKFFSRMTMMAAVVTAGLVLAYPAGSAMAAAPTAPEGAMFGFQGSSLDFNLVNHTGYQIKRVLVSPSRASEWSADNEVLHGRRFNDGEMLHITFNHHAHAEHWDLKVVYDDGSSKEWDGLNLDRIHKVTLFYDRRTDKTHADIE